jgi:5-dehydro-2-deoxygluconokinase
MPDPTRPYDVIAIGRTGIDLYSNDLGAHFEEISTFGAYVGGSSTNIAVACRRLGLRSALLTGFGDDPVACFIRRFLDQEGVETQFIPTLPGTRTPAVLLGIEPPDRFPLVFYRENAADVQLTIDHVDAAGLANFRVAILSGNALSRDPGHTATLYAAETARQAGTTVFLDLDFRADQWPDPRAYGVKVRTLLPNARVAIGTEEEVLAACLTDAGQLVVRHQQVSAPEVMGDLDAAIARILGLGVETLVVKRGAEGCSVFEPGRAELRVPGFAVEVVNVLGAGDAFAGGLTYGYLQGWDWRRTCRFANACGAILVTRHGCSAFMPTVEEVSGFVKGNGGW